MKRTTFKDLLFYLIVLVILIATVVIMFNMNKPDAPTYSEMVGDFESGKGKKFEIEGTVLKYTRQDGTQCERKLPSLEFFHDDVWETVEAQRKAGTLEYEFKEGFVPPWWMTIIPYIVLLVVFIGIWYFMFNRSGGGDSKAMSFKRAHPRYGSEEKKKKTFADVEGAEEEKEELMEIVEFLKDPARFVKIGARIPKGVLLVGPPGTGKTLLAKAVAGEAGTQFLSISGSDFVELYVGVGASRVRSLFEEAKKASPSIIFIDEIDAVGRHRGAGTGGGHDEREQTLNQLLVEMDGFGSNEGVIIIAATNRPDILDPALLRPGRFDRQVHIGLPDIKGREAILKLHAKGKPLDETVDLSVTAKTTPGFSGADLENLLNEAALLTARRQKPAVGADEMHEAMIKVIAGPAKKSKVRSAENLRKTAVHEAGHAIVMRLLPHADPVHQISIIPRGMALGMTISLPENDKDSVFKNEMLDEVASLLGGRVAEKLVLDDISTGASNDIQRATAIARGMVTKYGMSDRMGPVSFGSEHDEVFLGRGFQSMRNFSEETGAMIDAEIKSIIDSAHDRCVEILSTNMEKLSAVTEYLLEHETMDSYEFEKFFNPSADKAGS